MIAFRGPMRHATADTLHQIAPLLKRLRGLPLREPKPGTFYIKREAFLHFHEDPAGLFADLKVAGQWQRMPADTRAQQKALFEAARGQIAP